MESQMSSLLGVNSNTHVLHMAAENGLIEIVQSLVKRVPDLDVKDSNGETPLHKASHFGHLEVVKCLLMERADINKKNCDGATPLLVASRYSHKATVDFFIKFGANVDLCDGDECTLLHYASQKGWIDTVQYLLNMSLNLDTKDKNGKTALHKASSGGHLAIVKCLLKERADIEAKTCCGDTPLLCAAQFSHKNVVRWLIDYGANVGCCDGNECTVLHYASRNGWIDTVQSLVNRVPDLNARDKYGETALHKAVQFFVYPDVVKCLVKEKADINVKNCQDVTPLLCAARHYGKDVVNLLIYSGANVDGCDGDKCTLLHYASQNGWIEIVKFLVKIVPDLNARDKHGQTALYLACRNEELEVVQCLLEAGASFDINYVGNSPLSCLIRTCRPNVKLITLCIEKGAYVLPGDYNTMLKRMMLKMDILQDVKLCCQAIVNKFNNHDLLELYKLPVARRLPSIDKMKIVFDSNTTQAIEQTVKREIQAKGQCNMQEVGPKVLSVLSVKSVLEYYNKKL